MRWVILLYCLYGASHNDQLYWWNGLPLPAWWAIVKCCICIFYDIGPHQPVTGARIHSISPFQCPRRPESRRGESDIRPWARWCLISWLNSEALRPWQWRSSYLHSSILKNDNFFCADLIHICSWGLWLSSLLFELNSWTDYGNVFLSLAYSLLVLEENSFG